MNVVIFITTRPLESSVFKKLRQDIGAEHTSLLYYSNARWLSRDNFFTCMFELREEMYVRGVSQK